MTLPHTWMSCSSSSRICPLPVCLLLSTCIVKCIRFCSFFPKNWIDKNLGDELNLPARAGSDADWSTEKLNVILQRCLVSDRKGLNIHTLQMLEFESDLYRGIMRARCYPFDAQEYRFRGHNIKVHCMPQCLCLYPLS